MPVHLFGRPAPLAELAELGLPLIEDAAQAFGAEGVAQTGVCSTFSFFPTKNLFALGDGGLVACLDDEVAERVRMLRFHGSRDKKTFELIGTNSRLDAIQAAMLRVFLPRADGLERARGARRLRATRELGLGEVVELPVDEPGHVYHMYVVALVAARRDRGGARRRRGSRAPSYYVTPLHLQPAMRYLGVLGGLAARDRARGRGEPRAADVGRDRARRSRSASSRRFARPSAFPRSHALSGQPAPALAGRRRRGADRRRVGARPGTSASRATRGPSTTTATSSGTSSCSSSGSSSRSSSPSASTTAGGATSRRRTCGASLRGVAAAVIAAFLVFTLLDFHPASVPRGIWIVDLLLLLAFVMGVAPARAHAHRAAVGGLDRRAGQGGAHRRRRRRRAADPARDAHEPVARLHADRARRRRPAQEEPAPARDSRPRDDATSFAHLLRDRRPDELLIAIPSASGDVRERIVEIARARAGPGEDAARARTSSSPATSTSRARSGRSRWRTSSGASRSRSISSRSPATSTGEVVLVTGAGGSIGSELCRQIARMGPTRLVLVDNGEPGLFEIERELVDERGFHATAAVLADAGNATKMRQVFEKYRPAVVFHAAAYKHVAARWRRTRSRRCATTRSSRARSRTSRSSSARSASSSSRPTRP